MAKIRMPEKVESKPTSLQSQHISDKFKYSKNNNRSFDDLNHMINGVQSIKIFKSIIINSKNSRKMFIEPQNHQFVLKSNFAYKNNNVVCDDKKSDKQSDEDDEDDDDENDNLIERDLLKSQAYFVDRSTPYTETFHWSNSDIIQQNEGSTDYDISAKEILTDCEHKKKIDFCLDKLSNMNQERQITNSFPTICSDFTGASCYSVSPQNFYNRQRPSSSSSSSHSYCETPSPGNYQNPLDQHLEEQLDDNIMTCLPIWRENFNSSDTLVNSVDNSELQLQLIEEVIRGDMNDQIKNRTTTDLDLQVVPNCRSNSFSNFSNIYSLINNNEMLSSENSTYVDNSETTDDLTNTLLKFVRGEQTIISSKKLETKSSSLSCGYSNSSNEARKACNGNRLQTELMKNNYLEILKTVPNQFPQQEMVYEQQCTNLSHTMNAEDSQFSPSQYYGNGRNSWPNYPEANSIPGTTSVTNNFADFQIPETVMIFNSQRVESSNEFTSNSGISIKRSIAPWPSLNLPSTRAAERLKEVTDPLEVEKAMKNLLKRSLDQLTKGDEDGDTMLMCLVGNPLELRRKLAYLAPLVERLGTIEGALSSLNNRGEDALYLAAMNCPQMSFVAGYLAAACLQKNIDISQRVYRSRGDTLVHALAAKGDGHGEVLAELLSLKTAQGNSVFDLLKRNYDGRTALHIAAELHGSTKRNMKIVSIGIIQLLLSNGADPIIREVRCGDTALHLAISTSCDPSVVKILLSGRGQQAVNLANYNGNTPLHMAAIISKQTSLEQQLEICRILVHAGGRTNITNLQGKTPLALVSADRKETLRRVLQKSI